MAILKTFDINGKLVQESNYDSNLFNLDKPNTQVIFDQVIAENAGVRQNSASTLTKSEVRGGGIKPRPQKHTGRARQGSIRNPQWVGGGVAFGPKPTRNFKISLNKKACALALKSAFALKLNDNGLNALVDEIKITPSTKTIVSLVKNADLNNKKVLFIVNNEQEDLIKSANNIKKVAAKKWNQVSVKDVIHADVVFVQPTALINLGKVVE